MWDAARLPVPMDEDERHPKDPRNHPRWKPSKGRRFTHTWKDIAAVLWCSKKRAQNMAALHLFDPASLASIHTFANGRAAKKDRTT